MTKIIQIAISTIIAISLAFAAFAQTAGLMPMAQQQFFDNNGNPLSGGLVYTYIVGTTTLKTTWRDSAETIVNTNPIVLNAAGRAIIYGDGAYRQVVRDRNGNLIWDAVTSAAATGGATLFGDGTSVGTILPWSGITAPTRYVFAYGQELSRVTYSLLYTAITLNSNVNCTNGSNILTGLSDTTQIPIGSPVEASCVTGGTTVTAKAASTVTVTNNASVTISITARFFPWGNGNGTSTFNVPDLRGRVLAGRDNLGGTVSSRLTTAFYGANPAALGSAGGTQSKVLLTANLPAYTPAGAIVSTPSVVDTHRHFIANSDTGNPGSNVTNITSINQGRTGTTSEAGYSFSGTVTAPAVGLSGVTSAGSIAVTTTSTFTGTPQGGVATAFATIQPSITMNYIIKITADTNISTLNVVTSLGGMTGDITCSGVIVCSGQNISAAGLGTGDVIGASSAIDGSVVVFNGITGRIIKDSVGVVNLNNLTIGSVTQAFVQGPTTPTVAGPMALDWLWGTSADRTSLINEGGIWAGKVWNGVGFSKSFTSAQNSATGYPPQGIAPSTTVFLFAANDGSNNEVTPLLGIGNARLSNTTVFGGNLIARSNGGSLTNVKLVGLELDIEPAVGDTINAGSGGLYLNSFSTAIPVAIQIGGVGGGSWINGIIYSSNISGTGLGAQSGMTLGSLINCFGATYTDACIVTNQKIEVLTSGSPYNFNLPDAAGAAGECLKSGGGGTAVQTYGACSASVATPCTTTALSIQYNAAGVIGCISGVTSDGTLMRFSAANLALRATSAAFDLLFTATSTPAFTANRTLTFDMGNVAHTLAFGTTANTITFPNTSSDTVVMLTPSQTLTNKTLTAAVLNGTITGTSSVSSNTANTLVQRDGSGNFAAGTITAALTGNASTATALATTRAIYGNNFDGTVALAQIIASTFGGTGNGFTKFTGPTASEKTFTLPNASAAILTDNAIVTIAQGGTGLSSGTSGGILAFTASGIIASSGVLTANLPVIGGGVGVAPTVGTRSGNSTAFVTTTGTQTSGDCVTIDANGNHVANGSSCGASSGVTIGTTTIVSGIATRILYNNAGTIGEYTISGSGTVTAMATGASFAAIAALAIRDTSAAFDVTVAATSSVALSAGRTLTLNVGNVAHTLALGTTANTITFPNNASFTVAGLSVAQTWSAVQSFNSGNFVLNGSGSGSTTISASAAASGVITIPAATDTLVGKATTDTMTNKTLTAAILTGTTTSSAINSSDSITITGASKSYFNISSSATQDTGPIFMMYNNNASMANQAGAAFFTKVNNAGATIGAFSLFQVNNSGGFVQNLLNYDMNTNQWDFYTGNVDRFALNSSGVFILTMGNESGTNSAVCITTSTGLLVKATGAAGATCTVASSARFKSDIADLADGLSLITALSPKNYRYLPGYGDNGKRLQYGFTAEHVFAIIPDLVRLDTSNRPESIDLLSLTPVVIRAIQQLKEDNDKFRYRIEQLEARK